MTTNVGIKLKLPHQGSKKGFNRPSARKKHSVDRRVSAAIHHHYATRIIALLAILYAIVCSPLSPNHGSHTGCCHNHSRTKEPRSTQTRHPRTPTIIKIWDGNQPYTDPYQFHQFHQFKEPPSKESSTNSDESPFKQIQEGGKDIVFSSTRFRPQGEHAEHRDKDRRKDNGHWMVNGFVMMGSEKAHVLLDFHTRPTGTSPQFVVETIPPPKSTSNKQSRLLHCVIAKQYASCLIDPYPESKTPTKRCTHQLSNSMTNRAAATKLAAKKKDEAAKARLDKELSERAAKAAKNKALTVERAAKAKKKSEADERALAEAAISADLEKRALEVASAKKKKEEDEAAVRNAEAATTDSTAAAMVSPANEPQVNPTAMDVPDEGINDLLNGMNNVGVDSEEDEAMDGKLSPANSPLRKREKRTSKPKKDSKKKTASTKSKGDKRDRSGGSILQEGRFAASSTKAKSTTASKKTVEPARIAPTYDHKHKRIIMEGSVQLDAVDKHSQFQQTIGLLLENLQVVDPTLVVNPISLASKASNLNTPKDVPANFTRLGEFINIQQNAKAFEVKQPWGKNKDTNHTPRDPVVFFSVALSMDQEPKSVMGQVGVEWGRMKGRILRVKELQSFLSETPFMFFFLHNNGDAHNNAREFRSILQQAKDLLIEENSLDEIYINRTIPQIALRRNVPKLPGQDTSAFNKWPQQLQQSRRVMHAEVDLDDKDFLSLLIDTIKSRKLLIPIWGKQVHISAVVNWSSPQGDIKRLTRMSQHHTNFHASAIIEEVIGIVDIDEDAVINLSDTLQSAYSMSLREVMYNFLKLADGSSLCAEIHQHGSMGRVFAVIPNVPEAETMIQMINKQFAGYMLHTLKDAGVDDAFISRLLRRAVDPALVHESHSCTWDKGKRVLTTPAELEESEEEKTIEQQPWFQDVVSQYEVKAGKKKGRTYAAPESLFDLDGERSVTTIHQKNDGKYSGDEGVESFQVGRTKGTKETVVIDSDNEMESVDSHATEEVINDDALNSLSKDELLEKLKETLTKKAKDSASASKANSKSHSTQDLNVEYLSPANSSSAGSSSDDSSSSDGSQGSVGVAGSG